MNQERDDYLYEFLKKTYADQKSFTSSSLEKLRKFWVGQNSELKKPRSLY